MGFQTPKCNFMYFIEKGNDTFLGLIPWAVRPQNVILYISLKKVTLFFYDFVQASDIHPWKSK